MGVKERIRLAQEEREWVVTEKIRAEFEKENEVRRERFEQELEALRKEREAFETTKKEERTQRTRTQTCQGGKGDGEQVGASEEGRDDGAAGNRERGGGKNA